jgi:hypothetical protein
MGRTVDAEVKTTDVIDAVSMVEAVTEYRRAMFEAPG